MLSRALERTLHRALSFASERQHEYATLEHLLLGLTEDADAAAVLRGAGVDLDRLRGELTGFLDKDLAGLATDRRADPKPTAGFQRVVQRAAIHVQSAGRDEVTGANVLVALFDERESHAVYFLQAQDMTRPDAVNFINHGLAKGPGRARPPSRDDPRPADGTPDSHPEPDRAVHLPIRPDSALDRTIRRAMVRASERRHEYVTLEHLLLGLTDDAAAATMLSACGVDLDRLRADLTEFLDKSLAGLVTDRPGEPTPTAGFERVVQRAAIHVRSAGRDDVTGANVLVALFNERESHALHFLQMQEMTRLDAVNFTSHGVAKPAAGQTGGYKVLMIGDDVTPIGFVADLLMQVFGKSREEALCLMLEMHRGGSGVCGVFTEEVAQARMTQVMDIARRNRQPLQCTIERA